MGMEEKFGADDELENSWKKPFTTASATAL